MGIAGVLVVAVVGAGCGSGLETAAPASTTTTLSADDQRLVGEYVTAMQGLLRIRQFPSVSDDHARCAGEAVVEEVGLDRFRDAGLTPLEVTSIDHLADGDIELSRDEVDSLGTRIAACLPVDLGQAALEALPSDPGDAFANCVADAVIDVVADQLARQVAQGAETSDAAGFGEGQVAGVRCRWKAQPEGPSSGVTLAAGPSEFEAALADELLTAPLDIGAPILEEDQSTCFIPAILETLGPSNLEASETTARELARYVTGEGPAVLDIEVGPPQALTLARAYLRCVPAENLLRVQLELVGAPEDLIDPLIECFLERLPDDSLLDQVRLMFRLGVAGQATREGIAILEEQSQIGFECGRDVASTSES